MQDRLSPSFDAHAKFRLQNKYDFGDHSRTENKRTKNASTSTSSASCKAQHGHIRRRGDWERTIHNSNSTSEEVSWAIEMKPNIGHCQDTQHNFSTSRNQSTWSSKHRDRMDRLAAMVASRSEGSPNGARTARPEKRTRLNNSLVNGFYKTPTNAHSTAPECAILQ